MDIAEMHEKRIKQVIFPVSADGSFAQPLAHSDTVLLFMSATHHGDHDEFWIVEYHLIGEEFKEVKRHNIKYVESWEWL